MSTSDFTKFTGGTQDKGVNNFEPDIGAEITWDEATVNVTSGVQRGVGVRYGVAPLAGHSNTESPAGNNSNGIQRSEGSSGQSLTFREQIFGIVPITMAPYDGAYPKANRQFYVYLVGLDDSSNTTIDACVGCSISGGVSKQESTFVAGLATSSYRQESPLVRRHKTELLNLPQITTPTAASMQAILQQVSARYWAPYAHISVSGKRVPYQWMLGDVTVDPDATHTPGVNIWTVAFTSGGSPTVYCGAPSEIITRDFSANDTRGILVYCLDTNGYNLDMSYSAQITSANTTAVTAYGTGTMYAAVTGTKSGASTAYSSAEGALVNDPGSYTNTKHDAVLLAGEIPIAIIYQDWLMAVKGMMPRWVDLSSPGCIPRALNTRLGEFTGRAFASGSFNTTLPLTFSDANTGILRKNVIYDIGFSYYNKLIDYETNVQFFNEILNDTDDYTSCIPDATNGSVFHLSQTNPTLLKSPWEYSDTHSSATSAGCTGRGFSINDYEIRFYFRESGTSEWLPAGNYDAAQYWFWNGWLETKSGSGAYAPRICSAASGGLPGGQSSGFIDYSPLPKQRYICALVFQQRAFWWSEKTMQFSLTNNIYAYPTRNITACPTGKWRGGIAHSESRGLSQISRLIVFGDQTYSGRFTGEKTVQNVRISSDTLGQFEVDGSDFRLEFLSESTAFSFRSAVVADNILYWWGPQGIYQDNGVDPPFKISGILEPDIFAYVDMARDSEVHCVYNKRTSEILWFYPPKVADATYPTHGLIYNVENEKFYPFKMRCQVDSSQNIKLENDDTPDDVDGERLLIHCRETTASTIQRTFYFDDMVEAGEQGPLRELTVLTVATPVAGTRRLTLTTGSAGITASGIAANDLICIQNAKGYAPTLVLADDMIAKVTAVSNGSNYIEIALPDGASFDAAASLTGTTAFPIYQMHATTAGLHGITYNIATNYWLPDGLSNSWYWVYLYFLFKYTGIPTPTNVFTGLPTGAVIDLTYRSLVCTAALTDVLHLRDNSAAHCQIHHPMRNTGRAASGQALKYALSGIHIGNPWTLEYLEAHCKKENGFTLKEFEG